MGIRGLKSYISSHSKEYLRNFELHDTPLVVDGNCIACELYCIYLSERFVSDYGTYEKIVSDFLDDLLDCKVTPYFVIDGGSDDKKLSEICRRTREKISAISSQKQIRLIPILLKEVLKRVAREKNIKCVQSLFEADHDIASIAKILNCPVLSEDADFFVYDVAYIQFSTLDKSICRSRTGNGCNVWPCKIYKTDYVSQSFPGLDTRALPLAAVLLGCDYVDARNFNSFVSTLPPNRERSRTAQQIHAVLSWLRRHSLDSAIANILDKICREKREKMLKIIELVVNQYLIPSSTMLEPLGYSSEDVGVLMQKMPLRPYRYNGPKKFDANQFDHFDDFSNFSKEKLDVASVDEKSLCRMAPAWFLDEFKAGKYPSYFIDMLARQFYVCAVQLEDFSRPTCVNVSLKIVYAIFTLLNAGVSNSRTLKYVTRGEGDDASVFEFNGEALSMSCDIPPLAELRQVPVEKTKAILTEVLGVSQKLLDEFPSKWSVYIATIKYWLKESEEPFKKDCHLYPMLLTVLYSVFKDKIEGRQSQSTQVDTSLGVALKNVTKSDCVRAETFFTASLNVNNYFDINGIHAFSVFENCLKHSFHLNALLNYPYEETNIAELFDGALLYKLYSNFKNHKNINEHIKDILKKSPTLLQLYVTILAKFEAIL